MGVTNIKFQCHLGERIMKDKSAKEEKLDDVKSMAIRLRCSSRQVRRLNSAGLIPRSIKLSGSVRWISSEIDAWIQQRCNQIKTTEKK